MTTATHLTTNPRRFKMIVYEEEGEGWHGNIFDLTLILQIGSNGILAVLPILQLPVFVSEIILNLLNLSLRYLYQAL